MNFSQHAHMDQKISKETSDNRCLIGFYAVQLSVPGEGREQEELLEDFEGKLFDN